jgi:elongation factor 1-beta
MFALNVILLGHNFFSDIMGEQLIILKIMPTEPNKEKEIKKKLQKFPLGRIQEIREEPIAFGLVALKTAIITEAVEGITEKIVQEIEKIEFVQQAIIEGITLV